MVSYLIASWVVLAAWAIFSFYVIATLQHKSDARYRRASEVQKAAGDCAIERDQWQQRSHFLEAKLAQYEALPSPDDFNQKQAELDTMTSENLLLEKENLSLKRQLAELKRLTEVPEDGKALGV